jgi:hypothetical protein
MNCATFKFVETRVWSSQNPRLSRTPSCYHHHSKIMLRIPREDAKGFLVMDIPTNLVLSRGSRNFQVTGNLGWPAKRGFRSQKVSSSSISVMNTTRFRYFARARSMDRLQHHVWPPPLSSSATVVCCKDEMHSQLHLPDHDQLTRCCCVGRNGEVSFDCGMGSREKRTWWNEWVTKKEQQQQRLWRGLMAKTSMPVLDSYLLQELLSPLFHGAAGFTLLGISIGVAPEVMTLAEKVGLSFSHFTLFTKIILLRLPAYVGLALPMASLLASLLAFGRMGSDCEIIGCGAYSPTNGWNLNIETATSCYLPLFGSHHIPPVACRGNHSFGK